MAIIVAGYLVIKQNFRDEFVEKSKDFILLARNTKNCEDFSVSSDPIIPNRVNIFEKWASQSALDNFRNADSNNDLFSLVESFSVQEYSINT